MKAIRKTLTIGAAVAICTIAANWAGAAPNKEHSNKNNSSRHWRDSDHDDGRENWRKSSRKLHTRLPGSIVVEPLIIECPPPPRHRHFSVDIDTDRNSYYVGNSVRVTFRATDDAYVYIFSKDTAGVTRQIFPNYYDRDNFVRGGRTYSIPDRHYSLVTEGPAGRESLEIVAYRHRYDVLDRWHHFDRHEIFPQQSYSSEKMRKSVERELKSLRVHPRGHDRSWRNFDYAEDRTYFTTRYPSHWHRHGRDYDPPHVHYPSRHDGYNYIEGTIRITSSPSGAEVYIDGVYAGRTPGTFDADIGRSEVTLYSPGYKSKTMEINIGRSGEASISARLQKERW